jgi:hypothetical protein
MARASASSPERVYNKHEYPHAGGCAVVVLPGTWLFLVEETEKSFGDYITAMVAGFVNFMLAAVAALERAPGAWWLYMLTSTEKCANKF